MNLNEARTLAITLMDKHGLIENGWNFEFDRAKKRLGACHYSKRKITISHYMTEAADEETVTQTLLHEIAHALLPVGAGHGPQWKALAKRIGYTGKRTASNPYVNQERPVEKKVVVLKRVSTTVNLGQGDVVRFPDGRVFTIGARRRTRWNAYDEKGNQYSVSPKVLAPGNFVYA